MWTHHGHFSVGTGCYIRVVIADDCYFAGNAEDLLKSPPNALNGQFKSPPSNCSLTAGHHVIQKEKKRKEKFKLRCIAANRAITETQRETEIEAGTERRVDYWEPRSTRPSTLPVAVALRLHDPARPTLPPTLLLPVSALAPLYNL